MRRRWSWAAWRPRPALKWRIAVNALLFVSTGVVQTIAIQTILYSGAGDRLTFLVAIPQYAGITMVYFAGDPFLRFLARIGGSPRPVDTADSTHQLLTAGQTSAAQATKATSQVLGDAGAKDEQPQPTSHPKPSSLSLMSTAPANKITGSTSSASLSASLPSTEMTPSPKVHAPTGRTVSIWDSLFHPERRKLYVLALNEVGGFVAGLTGLALAGSGLYQVIHSGVTVFTAILSTIFLKRRLSVLHWIAVAVITGGLALTAGGAGATPTTFSPPHLSATASARASAAAASAASAIFTGVSITLVSCLFYACNYVIAEYLLDDTRSTLEETAALQLPPPTGKDLSLITGGSCFLLFSLYIIFHTIPHWHALVTVSIEQHHGQRLVILLCYVSHFVASYLHAVTHYDIVASIGAVPIGVMQGIRAISVFAVSSMLFCSSQSSQCYTSRKGIATAIVICGALMYNYASSKNRPVPNSSQLPLRTPSNSSAATSVGASRTVRPALRRKDSALNLDV